jgi:hypothetical protein
VVAIQIETLIRAAAGSVETKVVLDLVESLFTTRRRHGKGHSGRPAASNDIHALHSDDAAGLAVVGAAAQRIVTGAIRCSTRRFATAIPPQLL